MKRLAILGASGHGKVVAEIAELSAWSDIVFFDDAFPEVTSIGVWSVQGDTADLLNQIGEFDGCIVAIGNNEIRLEKTRRIVSSCGQLVSLVHPSCIISKYAEIGTGSVVMAGAVINPFAKLGIACIVNTAVSIDHDCEIGKGVHLSPGVNLAGAVKVGQKSWVGIGASVKQCVSIGDNVIVGAGAAVVSDILNDLVVVGVPARVKTKLDVLMLNTKFSSWPSYTEEEANAIHDVLLSNRVNYWTGNECREFEKEFAAWCGTEYSVALANGTVALDAAFKALGIGAGDEVIVTSRTFLASVSSIVNAGAVPVFADISRDSQNITPESVRAKVTFKTKAILCVHLAGWPCEMDGMMALADEFDLFIIEDCAQAHGAKYKDKPVGSIGHIGTWSFCQDKIMTTGGEGGMVTTNSRELWSKMWSYKDHGKSWESVYEQEHPPGFRWLHDSFGTNWRMTEMQAAIGRIQLKRMENWSTKRISNSNQTWVVAKKLPGLRVPVVPDYINHAAYKCYVFVEYSELKEGWNRDRIMAEINSLGVPCFSGSCSEVYLEKAFDNTGFRPIDSLPVAKELGETSLMFLVHPTLTKAEIQQTCDAIQQVMQLAQKQV